MSEYDSNLRPPVLHLNAGDNCSVVDPGNRMSSDWFSGGASMRGGCNNSRVPVVSDLEAIHHKLVSRPSVDSRPDKTFLAGCDFRRGGSL